MTIHILYWVHSMFCYINHHVSCKLYSLSEFCRSVEHYKKSQSPTHTHLALVQHNSWSGQPDDSHLPSVVLESLSSMRAGSHLLPGGMLPPQPWDKPHQSHADVWCPLLVHWHRTKYLKFPVISPSLPSQHPTHSPMWGAGLDREEDI